MTPFRIPEESNAELLRQANEGRSTRELAEWLIETKQLERCSHMTVARRLHRLRLAAAAPAGATPETLARMLHANDVFVDDLLDSLAELEEVALNGDEARDLPPDLAAAERLVRRRSQIVEQRQRNLMKRLELAERTAQRTLEENQSRQEADRIRQRSAELNLEREKTEAQKRDASRAAESAKSQMAQIRAAFR